LSVGGLELAEVCRARQVRSQTCLHQPLQNLGDCRQVGDGPIVCWRRSIEPCLLRKWQHLGRLEPCRERSSLQRLVGKSGDDWCEDICTVLEHRTRRARRADHCRGDVRFSVARGCQGSSSPRRRTGLRTRHSPNPIPIYMNVIFRPYGWTVKSHHWLFYVHRLGLLGTKSSQSNDKWTSSNNATHFIRFYKSVKPIKSQTLPVWALVKCGPSTGNFGPENADLVRVLPMIGNRDYQICTGKMRTK